MADIQIYGMHPGGHHLTSVFIHTASAILLFILLVRLTKSPWRSTFVALLFALHPLHIESVAWVAERKDVLSAFFCFLTLLLYSEYVARQNRTYYLFAFVAFLLGLMSKPMLVTLPLIMLLIDHWPLNRFKKKQPSIEGWQRASTLPTYIPLLKEKIPFFVCSLGSGLVTIYAQQGAIQKIDALPLWPRLANATVTYLKYIGKMLWPTDLAVFYPFFFNIPTWQVAGAALLLLSISVGVIRLGKREPYLVTGWFWYLLSLLPVIGILQVGAQSMADRYTYIPLTGLFIIAAWGIPLLIKGIPYSRVILMSLAFASISAAAISTYQQLKYWQDSITLFERAILVTSKNALAHNNLASAMENKGDFDAAVENYLKAIDINPNYIDAYYNLGNALVRNGYASDAIELYRNVIALNDRYARAYTNLGVALSETGDIDQAINAYRKAIEIDPRDFLAHNNLGFSYEKTGLIDKSIHEYKKALELSPSYVNAHINLGNLYLRTGQIDNAIDTYKKATGIAPGDYEAHNNLGVALLKKGHATEAIAEFEKAIRIDGTEPAAIDNLKDAYILQKKTGTGQPPSPVRPSR